MKWINEPVSYSVEGRNTISPRCLVNCSSVCALDFDLPCVCAIKTCHGVFS